MGALREGERLERFRGLWIERLLGEWLEKSTAGRGGMGGVSYVMPCAYPGGSIEQAGGAVTSELVEMYGQGT